MKCKKCGIANEDDAKFCLNCGTELKKGKKKKEENTDAKIVKSKKIDVKETYSKDELVQRVSRNELLEKRNRKILIFEIIFAILSLAAIVTIFYYAGNSLQRANGDDLNNVPDGENQIVERIDELVGAGNYEIVESFESSTGKYVAKVVLNEYKEQYEALKDKEDNKYVIKFSLDDQGNLDSYYETFRLGMEYENKIRYELSELMNIDYKYIVIDNPLLDASSKHFDNAENLDQVYEIMSKRKSLLGEFTINIYVKSDVTETSSREMINNNNEYFKNNYIDKVTVLVMKDDNSLNELNFDGGLVTKSSKEVEKSFVYNIE